MLEVVAAQANRAAMESMVMATARRANRVGMEPAAMEVMESIPASLIGQVHTAAVVEEALPIQVAEAQAKEDSVAAVTQKYGNFSVPEELVPMDSVAVEAVPA